MKKHLLFLLTLTLTATSLFAQESQLMKVKDVAELSFEPPVATFSYGKDENQFGDLRVPEGKGPFPVVVIIHGGCWLSSFDLHLMDAMATDLTNRGYATWNLEYRRVGNVGGGVARHFP
ncbi:MAG: hypothetical protein AAFO07_04690, partial [Bacteroidota bacterium]